MNQTVLPTISENIREIPNRSPAPPISPEGGTNWRISDRPLILKHVLIYTPIRDEYFDKSGKRVSPLDQDHYYFSLLLMRHWRRAERGGDAQNLPAESNAASTLGT